MGTENESLLIILPGEAHNQSGIAIDTLLVLRKEFWIKMRAPNSPLVPVDLAGGLGEVMFYRYFSNSSRITRRKVSSKGSFWFCTYSRKAWFIKVW